MWTVSKRNRPQLKERGMIINNDIKNVIMLLTARPGKGDNKGDATGDKVRAQKRATAETPKKKVNKDISLIEKYLNRTVRLEVDSELHSVIAKVIDKTSGEVIRQIPPEEFIELAKKIKEKTGHLLNKEA